MLRFPLILLFAVALSQSCERAQADSPVRWRVAEGLVFSAEELERAVSARLLGPAQGLRCAPLEVRAEGASRVLVLCGTRGEVVELGARVGADAARRVALVLLSLAADDFDVALPAAKEPAKTESEVFSGEGETPDPAAPPEELHSPSPLPAVVNPTSSPPSSLKIWGRAAFGAGLGLSGSDAAIASGEAALALRLGSHALSLGLQEQRSQTQARVDVAYRIRSVHAGLGSSAWGLRGTVFAGLAFLKAETLATYDALSLEVGARLEKPFAIGSGVELAPWASAQGFSRRASFEGAGEVIRTTPRVLVQLGVGLCWRFGDA